MRLRITDEPSPTQAVWELILAASVWGFGFICTRWALDYTGPFWLNALRFNLAFWPFLPLLYFVPRFRKSSDLEQFLLAFWPGLMLGAAIIFQTAGLPYTTVTKSSFITVLYIVFVPLFEHLVFKIRVHWLHYLIVALALIGSGFICEFNPMNVESSRNKGDLLTLGCALVASFQILWLEKFSDRIGSSFVFNLFQSFWAGVMPLILAIGFEVSPHLPIPKHSLWGLVLLAFGSSLFAFLIQVRTQKVLSSSLVSMLFLLESPFAALFAYYIFQERMNTLQWIGTLLILISAGATVLVHQFLDPTQPSSKEH